MKIQNITFSKMKVTTALVAAAMVSPVVNATTITEALTSGKAYGNFNLRYETVDQDNALKDADALTLRTRLGYVTGAVSGFSATIEVEDSRVVFGQDDYSVPPTGFKTGEYSVIADPESTEVDQGFIQYKAGGFTGKLGRQVITLDGHRFVGHVGWRQDRQTFDGLSATFAASDKLTLKGAYITQRNRIFADVADIHSEDILLNAALKTPIGTVTGYAYLLEVDNDIDNGLDTYGISLKGSKEGFTYAAEYATQDSDAGAVSYDADYMFLEGGAKVGPVTAKLGYEVLGSDDGAYGFSTPLATLHKFNGWTDQFLGTPSVGLEDLYLSLSTKVAGGKLAFIYHDFSADDSAGADDLGDEIDLLYVKKFGKNYAAGIKYGAYSAGDASFGKVDTDKLWIWGSASF